MPAPSPSPTAEELRRTSIAILAVACAGLAALWLRDTTGSTRTNSVFAVGILLIGYAYGFRAACLAAALSLAAFFAVVRPQQLGVFLGNNLVIFLGAAAVSGWLLGLLRRVEQRAQRQHDDIRKLEAAARDFAGLEDEQEIRFALIEHVKALRGDEAHVGEDLGGLCATAGIMRTEFIERFLHQAAGDSPFTYVVGDWAMRRVVARGREFGAVAWRWRRPTPKTSPLNEDAPDLASDIEDAPLVLLALMASQALARSRKT